MESGVEGVLKWGEGMLHIAVCDDEEYFRVQMKNCISVILTNMGCDFVIDLYESGISLVQSSGKNSYHMVFLDINMADMNGIDTAKEIRKSNREVYIVFVTANITYALEGYKVDAVRYLLKDDRNFAKTVQECLESILEKMKYVETKIEFEVQNNKIEIQVDKIFYIESRLHKVVFHVEDTGFKEYYMYTKLDEIEKKLKKYGFFRTHQSFLVNMKYVVAVERYKAKLEHEIEISISKKYYKDFESEYVKARGTI